jgi:hypothetical protein
MKNAYKMLLASAIALPMAIAPAIAVAQHTAPGAPLVQGQQRHPDTTVAPRGSAPETAAVGEISSMSVSDLSGLAVVNELGEPIGDVDRVVQGDGGLVYVVVTLEDGRPVVFPIMLMGVHEENLVVQGYGQDILRAQTLEPNALAGFNPVHPAEVVEIPQVALVQQ